MDRGELLEWAREAIDLNRVRAVKEPTLELSRWWRRWLASMRVKSDDELVQWAVRVRMEPTIDDPHWGEA